MKHLLTKLLCGMAIVGMLLGGLAFAPRGAEAGLWWPDKNECAFLGAINKYRQAHGVRPLTFSRSLGAAAEYHAMYMARTDDVDHTLGNISWVDNIFNFGYPTGQGMGENVLAGRQSADGALLLWKSSPGHNQNMLDPNWVTIGVGRAVNLNGKYGFYWATTFGSHSHRTISC
jgi:uncharacterized protein YkwD